ncbi:MAG: hypothetical protein OXH22_10105 [Chloroflexi bacterium]|nr:hypothetical protein [Chloroflexota bacterium]MYC07786.1 hypothetical protein [Chloroflexota bacterium]
MTDKHFPNEVAGELKWYVYRLIDPRNGETFYIGKGKNDRVFAHVNGMKGDYGDYVEDQKRQRINDIQAAGLEVGHIIHRHGMASESTAYEVEAALIDAYPGLVNKVAGKGSRDFGTRHASEIIAEYRAEPFEVEEKLILISIGRMWRERGVYEAVRGRWKIHKDRIKSYKLVLAHVRGLVRGAYIPRQWLPGTREHFPLESEDAPDRIGFVGDPAGPEVWNKYVGKRVPGKYRKKGAANPIRYCDP